jgi:hypothetical protein
MNAARSWPAVARHDFSVVDDPLQRQGAVFAQLTSADIFGT